MSESPMNPIFQDPLPLYTAINWRDHNQVRAFFSEVTNDDLGGIEAALNVEQITRREQEAGETQMEYFERIESELAKERQGEEVTA